MTLHWSQDHKIGTGKECFLPLLDKCDNKMVALLQNFMNTEFDVIESSPSFPA